MAAEPLARQDLPADMDHLPVLMDFVTDVARAAGLGPQDLYRVDLAAEEILTNIIKYAYPGGPGRVVVACGRQGPNFVMEFSDSGVPFDPLAAGDPLLSEDIHDRPVGGLGIHLVRQVMDEVVYQRRDQTNLLKLAKIITGG